MRILDSMFDSTLNGLEKAMQLQLRRHHAISSNVSNAETPQYRAVDFTFGKELDRAFGLNPAEEILKTNPKHIDIIAESGSHLIADFSGATKPDGNNVDMDLQMAKMQHNMSKYTGAAQLVQTKFRMLKNLVREAV